MRKAIYDLKKKCKSLKNQVKNIGGKKVYRMLHSINEREEAAKEEIKEEDEEQEEEKTEEPPIIGHADKREIVKVFQNCHKNLKQFQIGSDSQSDFILSDKKLDMRKISRKISKLSSYSDNSCCKK
jgi:hypothetical protein